MNNYISSVRQLQWLLWPSLAAGILSLFLGIYSIPVVHAEEPPDDCWGGTMSADPLHCHVIDEAHREGIVEVEGIYDDGNGALYIFFNYLRTVEDRVYPELMEYFRQKGKEFALQYPDRVTYGFDDHRCRPLRTTDDYATFEDCMMYYTFFVDDYIVPWELPYDRIVLRTGGSDARRQERAWAAWTQEWPSTGATGSSGTASQFDVSDVDVTNFPELDCLEHSREFVHGQACFEWVENPELGIAGWYSSGWNSITYYVQVKAPPRQEGNVETAKAELKRLYGYDDDQLVMIPVKYDLKELWQWTLVLDRFAVSSGNTIGITGAEVAPNLRAPGPPVIVFPLASLPEVDYNNLPGWRETIRVWTLDAQRVANALPTLLPQLGIPIDAVGVVAQVSNDTVGLVVPVPGSMESSNTQVSADDSASSQPVAVPTRGWIWGVVGGGMGLGILALASAVILKVKRHRRVV